jgi:hypothetical protein
LQLIELQLFMNFYIKINFTRSCNQLQPKLQLTELQLLNYSTIFNYYII